MMRFTKKMMIIMFLSLGLFLLSTNSNNTPITSIAQEYGELRTHRFEDLPDIVLPDSNYISYTHLRNVIAQTSAQILSINPQTWGKIIRIDTAEELYRFSLDVSYKLKYTTFETKLTENAIERLLSLHYVLGNDIDYSVMRSKQFNPIGYNFSIENTTYQQSFTGIFDGNGFEISNLYFSGYNQLTEILNEGTEFESTVSYVEYYSMFAYNDGIIRNFGLVNPTYEFNFESETLFKAANIIGRNGVNGVVSHIYAVDSRASALISGIRMVAGAGQASGVLFDNYGEFSNAYFAGRVVMNASYGSRFNVQPVLYENHASGSIANLAFDDTVYQEIVNISGSSYSINQPNAYATSMTTSQLRNTNSVLGSGWYYYPAQNNPTPRYPALFGLDSSTTPYQVLLSDESGDFITLNNYFIIDSALDLISFSKMLNFTRQAGLTPFRELNYLIIDNIDMSSVAENAYSTPTVEFSGIFTGKDQETYIQKLKITNGIASEAYYAGLFSVVTGSVYNLIFFEATLSLNETNNYASVPTYVGLIAGQLNNGIIRNVLVDVTINLGTATLGELHVGAISGQASGNISSVYTDGEIIGNLNHIYRTDIVINPTYHLGGIVGSTGDLSLVLIDAYNHIDIQGIGTTSTTMNASSNPTLYMGGIIGLVDNKFDQIHTLGLLTNDGLLTIGDLKSQYTETQYVSGVIGMSKGLAYNIVYPFGDFTNKGSIDVRGRGSNIVFSAGILVSNHSENVEFVHLFNEEEAEFIYYTENPSTGAITGDFSNLEYTSLVLNVGQTLILSQARNEMDIMIYGQYDYSGVYFSTNQAYTYLRFVENNGNITFQNQSLSGILSIAGITQSTNVDFLNVTYNGDILVLNVTMQSSVTNDHRELFVAGIAKTLTNGRFIKNSLVTGNIITAGIVSNQINRNNRNNIYVAGFVNYNFSGNMDPNGNQDYPKASIGIINSINKADLTSSYSSQILGISGHANVFAGGFSTFNDGDIQDVANIGNIRFENTSNIDTANTLFNTVSTEGGRTTKFRHGVILGGISSAVLSSKSRIYDSTNSGDIIALSKNFARSGGILGLAIFQELDSGNIDLLSYTLSNSNIRDSILSNTINYGNVAAITISISTYSSSNTTVTLGSVVTNNFRFDITQDVSVPAYDNSFYGRLTSGRVRIDTRVSTQERPGINASAGGVIGYGLSVMRRMINHGQVSATDVAGGVVGATVVIGTNEFVKIDTAINYGTVRAFDRGTPANSYANFNAINVLDYETIRDGFYPVDSTFIFPSTRSNIRLFPEAKRGFGGIFGRLQRAANRYMYGNNDANSTFNYIINLDPNVDLIGRLDQVDDYMSSIRFFDFRNSTYYSARKNDTTQTVFTGMSYFYDNSNNQNSALYATRTVNSINITSRKYVYNYNGASDTWVRTTHHRTTSRTEVELFGQRSIRIANASAVTTNYQTEIISRSAAPAHNSSGWSLVSGSSVVVGTSQDFKYAHDLPLYNQVWDLDYTKVITNQSTTQVPNGYYLFGTTLAVPLVTEEANDQVGQYIYSPTFEMQTDTSLQEFIYFAENGNLSERFEDVRPNGMYVLSTSSGSTFGAILPANLVFSRLLPLKNGDEGELPSSQIDYELFQRIDSNAVPLYQSLQSDYLGLFQTRFSDKSRLLENQSTLELREIDGSMTKLLNPSIIAATDSNPLGVITFNLNLATLDFTQSNLSTVEYQILNAQLPSNAVIAKTIEDYYGLPYGSNISSYLESYRGLLLDYANPLIPPENKPDLEPTFSHTFNINSPQTGIINIGYFTSFSQVSQNFTSFLNDNYVTDYLVRLNVSYSPSATMPFLYSYQIDGGTVRTQIVENITVQQVSSTLRFNFRDPSGILPIGTDILNIGSYENDNVVLEYLDSSTGQYVTVDYEDFSLSSDKVILATNRPFSFTLFVNPKLKSGQYRVGFRLLPYQQNKTYYRFTKAGSNMSQITELEHYSSGVITPSGTSFTSSVNFGYPLDFSDLTVTEVINPLAKPYQATASYYTIPFLNEIYISEFASITSVELISITYNNGFRTYNVRYTVRAENGTSQTTYNHQIVERTISIFEVYRNNNKVLMTQLNPVIITREALTTDVSINFNVDPTYASSIYNLESDDPDSYFSISPAETDGVAFSVTDKYLVFTIDSTAVAANYSFVVSYKRTGEPDINLGTVYIRKNQGTNAYLFDIQFAELATETNYAPIFVSNTSGVPIASPYSPSIYYAGIDYDGANTAGVTQFRVDGQVSNIPLDSYIPFFLNHLPLGATVSKKDNTTGLYGTEVNGPFDLNIGALAADFTSSEGNEDDDLIITYRVTAENGVNQVYYHITVTDVTYNVSYIFDVVYVGNSLRPTLDDISLYINVRNMNTNLPVTDSIVSVLPAFHTVTGYTNSTNLFYVIGQNDYKFRFGRNKSGFYSFNVNVLDPNGYLYDYTIEINDEELANVADYDVNSRDQGKYYYINSSTKNRSRSFVITISNARIPDRDYGFSDHDRSWK